MRMFVGRSMRKWRWWCLVKCAMACKPCKSATCRGSLMIASPVQREIASGHLYLCALLISPCNSSPFRANLNRGKEHSSIRDRGIQQFKILRDQLSNCLENFSNCECNFLSMIFLFIWNSIYFEILCNENSGMINKISKYMLLILIILFLFSLIHVQQG